MSTSKADVSATTAAAALPSDEKPSTSHDSSVSVTTAVRSSAKSNTTTGASSATSAQVPLSAISGNISDLVTLYRRIEQEEGKNVLLTKADVEALTKNTVELCRLAMVRVNTKEAVADQMEALKSELRSAIKDRETLRQREAQWASKYERVAYLRDFAEQQCKELQQQNRAIQENAKAAYEAQRNSTSALQERIEATMAQVSEHSSKVDQELRATAAENAELKNKLSKMLQYDSAREEHTKQIVKTVELEKQLLSARLKQQEELTLQHRTFAEETLSKLVASSKAEDELRGQLKLYGSKFDEVQGVMAKSSASLQEFKKEIDKSRNETRKAEAEKEELRKKHAALAVQLIDIQKEVMDLRKQLQEAQTRNVDLQSKNERVNAFAMQLAMKLKTTEPNASTEASEKAALTDGNTAASAPEDTPCADK